MTRLTALRVRHDVRLGRVVSELGRVPTAEDVAEAEAVLEAARAERDAERASRDQR